MAKICTDKEQSKKLIELGIDVNSADMHWQYIEEDNGQLQWFYFPKDFSINENESIPAWSLSTLLNIIKNRKDCNKIELFSNYASKWVLTTTYYNSVWKEMEFIAECPIDTAFEMVVWLKENKKI